MLITEKLGKLDMPDKLFLRKTVYLDKKDTTVIHSGKNVHGIPLEEVIERMRKRLEECGSITLYAKELRLPRSTLDSVFRGKLLPNAECLSDIGLRKQILFSAIKVDNDG